MISDTKKSDDIEEGLKVEDFINAEEFDGMIDISYNRLQILKDKFEMVKD